MEGEVLRLRVTGIKDTEIQQGMVWRSVIPAGKGVRQEDEEFKTRLGYMLTQISKDEGKNE